MADAATLIVLVAAGDAADATTHAMARATREALGPTAHVIVRETPGEPADADVAATERSDNPDAVVELSWIGPRESRHRQATVRVHLRTGKWVDRWITFRPTDADAERGRTVGFAIASILPEDSSPSAGSPSTGALPGVPATSGPSSSPPTSSTSGPSSSGSDLPPSGAGPAPTMTPPPSGPTTTPTPHSAPSSPALPHETPQERVSVLTADLVGIWFPDQNVGFGQRIGGAGVSGSAQYFVFPTLSARLGGSLRAGSVTNLSDTDGVNFTVGQIFAGVVFHPIRARLSERFGVSIRGAWVLEIAGVTHTPLPHATATPAEGPQVNDGPELAVDASVLIVPDVEALVGGGGQYLLRSARIRDGSQVITWSPARPFGEAGFRIRF